MHMETIIERSVPVAQSNILVRKSGGQGEEPNSFYIHPLKSRRMMATAGRREGMTDRDKCRSSRKEILQRSK
jgi:hypothetical protein